jgi:hypothetical protein
MTSISIGYSGCYKTVVTSINILFLLSFSVHIFNRVQIFWHMALCGLVQDWAVSTLKMEAAVCCEV